MSVQHRLILCTVATALVGLSFSSHAKDLALTVGSGWNSFSTDRDALRSDAWFDLQNTSFERLYFTFEVAAGDSATLSVVDGDFAGNTFSVFNGVALLGNTSAVPALDLNTAPFSNFEQAFADPTYSRATFNLGAGSYRITGNLTQASLDGTAPVWSTSGAVRVDAVSAVPEPSAYAMFLAGLGMMVYISRRQRR
jgi:hypothetical protein